MKLIHTATKTKKARKLKGLSQRELSYKLGFTSGQFVSNVERGLCLYPVKKFRLLSKIIDYDVKKLFADYIRDVSDQAKRELGL